MNVNSNKKWLLKFANRVQLNKISYWQLIVLQSKANGCFYQFENLPRINWHWPTGTWFQERKNEKLTEASFVAQRMNNQA